MPEKIKMSDSGPGLNIVALKYGLVVSYILYFLLNFLGSPHLKEAYIILLLMHFSLILLFTPEEAIPAMLALSFVEGQGRVLWGYNPIFRIVFDLCLFIIVLKIIIAQKKIMNAAVIPLVIRALIFLHLIWFILENFNLNGAGPLVSLATAKYYVFPFLLFFAFTLLDLSSAEFREKKMAFNVAILVLASALLCIYQIGQGETMMFKISGNYQGLFLKYKEFTKDRYRPWGTSHVPGGQSLFIFLTVGFVFISLRNMKGRLKYFIFMIMMGLSWFTLFINNVRSAFLKHILLFIACSLISFFSSSKKINSFRSAFIALSFFAAFALLNVERFDRIVENLNLGNSLTRIQQIKEKGVSSQRGSWSEITHRIKSDTNWPFGYGLGMSTGFLPEFIARREQLVGVPDYKFWSGDNLFLFLFLEMGVGGIFYISIVILNVVYLGQMTLRLYDRDQRDSFLIVGICFASVLVITIGQWGVVGIPFNPESIFYWLWVAMGYSEYHRAKLLYYQTLALENKS